MWRACFLKGAAVELLRKKYRYIYAITFILEKAPAKVAPAIPKAPRKDDDKDDKSKKCFKTLMNKLSNTSLRGRKDKSSLTS
jgi:hypothetical protein